jgi:hypothetical protein
MLSLKETNFFLFSFNQLSVLVGYSVKNFVFQRDCSKKWPVERFYPRIVAAKGGKKTTGDVIQLILKSEEGTSAAAESEILEELQRFYLAARDSGQLLMRSATAPELPATQNLHLYKLEFDE